MKTAVGPENFDERSAVVVKMEKCGVFKFILRLYYVPGRFSLRLTHLSQVLTTSNTFPLILPRAFTRVPRPMRSYYVLTTTNQIAPRA